MLTIARLFSVTAALALVAAGSGCIVPVAAGAAAGYGSYEYVNGEMSYAVYASVDKTWKAVGVVLKERGWDIKDQSKDATTAYFRCITKDNIQVKIDVARRSSDFTRVTVRYGVFGDEKESQQLIEQVKAKL